MEDREQLLNYNYKQENLLFFLLLNLLKGDLALPNGVFVSRNDTPKEWIKNVHNAVLGYNFYATAFMEIVDETE